MKTTILIIFSSIMLISCHSIFNSVVTPNQCKKCRVIDLNTNAVVFENEGCGGTNVRLEEKAKEAAYDLSRNGNLCNLSVECETWRQDPEDN
ncbi:MAG: hypothetical protein AB8B53_12225 [Flavobacteriales bacterium]